MDTTTTHTGDDTADAALIADLAAALDDADPAEAPEIALEIALRLNEALDSVPGASTEQLRAFDWTQGG